MKLISQLQLAENNIAFHPSMGNSYQLNTIAKEIIGLLQQNRSKDEIIALLSDQYDISEDILFIDVSDFLSKLKIYGLYQ